MQTVIQAVSNRQLARSPTRFLFSHTERVAAIIAGLSFLSVGLCFGISTHEYAATSKNAEALLQDQIHRELVYRPLQFHEGRQYFIGVHDETFSVAARIHNPYRSAFAIHSFEPTQSEAGVTIPWHARVHVTGLEGSPPNAGQCLLSCFSRALSHKATGQSKLHKEVLRLPLASSECHRRPDRYIRASNNVLSQASMLMKPRNVL